MNQTQILAAVRSPMLVWCFVMPLIHLLSLISNVLCIIVFCSKAFIHKPIAVYFICLLISDSITLLIGYTEMLDRESHMIDPSFVLCRFNSHVIHELMNLIYSFMGRFCLEWLLYKVLWTRASTILLAILSIQRSRTLFSLSYHETRSCALLACLVSVLIAVFVTCFEWTGIQCGKAPDERIYVEILQLVADRPSSRDFYAAFLSSHYNESSTTYACLSQALEIGQVDAPSVGLNLYTCPLRNISSEFYSLTQSLLSHGNHSLSGGVSDLLTGIFTEKFNHSDAPVLAEHIQQTRSSELMIKLFERRPCQIHLAYSVCLKLFDFLHSLCFGFNRHTLSIFFGNALPSFVVFLANILSIKVIYCSKNLNYLKSFSNSTRRKHRVQSDLRAFLVILIEGFSVITISWGIPIFLTMYHCGALYVVSIAACPAIKKSLAFFLFTDLFNSSTNCLLYSLSGKLFRRQFLSLVKLICTCGRGFICRGFKRVGRLSVESQPSLNASYGTQPRQDTRRSSEFVPSIRMVRLSSAANVPKQSNDTGSFSIIRTSEDRSISYDANKKRTTRRRSENAASITAFLLNKIRSITSSNQANRSNEAGRTSNSVSSHTVTSGHSLQPMQASKPSARLTITSTGEHRIVSDTLVFENVTSV